MRVCYFLVPLLEILLVGNNFPLNYFIEVNILSGIYILPNITQLFTHHRVRIGLGFVAIGSRVSNIFLDPEITVILQALHTFKLM